LSEEEIRGPTGLPSLPPSFFFSLFHKKPEGNPYWCIFLAGDKSAGPISVIRKKKRGTRKIKKEKKEKGKKKGKK